MARLPLEQLAEFLVESGHISAEQQQQLVTIWKDRSAKAGQTKKLDPIAFVMGLHIPDRLNPEITLGDVAIARVLAKKADLPTVKLDPLKLDMDFVHKIVSRPFAARFLMIPLAERDGHILMAVADPFDTEGMDVFRQTSPLPVKRFVTPYGDLVRIIHEFYGLRASLSKAEQTMTQGTDLGNLEQLVRLQTGRRSRPARGTWSTRWNTSSTTPTTCGPATSTSNPSAITPWCASASTGCCTRSPPSPRSSIPPS